MKLCLDETNGFHHNVTITAADNIAELNQQVLYVDKQIQDIHRKSLHYYSSLGSVFMVLKSKYSSMHSFYKDMIK